MKSLSRAEGAEASNTAKAGIEWVKTELFLGRNIPTTEHEVSELEFTEFVSGVVTEYFPKGLTIYDAYGQIQDSDGKIDRQATWVMVIVHERNAENSRAIEAVIAAYREEFGAPEVMRLTSPVEVQFYVN